MVKNPEHIEIEIDKLTNSIENVFSGDSFETVVKKIHKEELHSINKGNGWKFDWKYEYEQSDRDVYKLTIQGNDHVIQGLVSFSDENDHLFIHLIESAPFNQGKNKIYAGVPGNLFAFVYKESWERANEGFVAFISKTRLIDHYERSIGAKHVGGHKLIIFPNESQRLINKYFKN